VCRPLHRIEVDAVLEHFPQRRQFAQLADLVAQQVYGVVDLFLGGEAPDGKADGAVRKLVRASQGAQRGFS